MPKISVIVPVYKVELYLKRCIDSILNQTFKDFELILVDDGSPDNCPHICDEYTQRDDRVVVIHQANAGLSAARNAGIDWAFMNSDSKWLSFVDSDDWIHPSFLEYLYQAVLEHPVKISICNVERTENDINTFSDAIYHSIEKDAMKFYIENDIWATVAWNKLYAKSLFKEYRYPVGRIHEDEFLTYKLLYEVHRVAWIDYPLYQYYQRSDSIIGSKYLIKYLDAIVAISEQVDFFKNKSSYLYNKKLLQLIKLYYSSIKKIEEIPDTKELQISLTNDYVKLFKKYKKQLKLKVKKYPYLYELAYPKYMNRYWTIQIIYKQIYDKGIWSVIKKMIIFSKNMLKENLCRKWMFYKHDR